MENKKFYLLASYYTRDTFLESFLTEIRKKMTMDHAIKNEISLERSSRDS
jgi:hypothetical protein